VRANGRFVIDPSHPSLPGHFPGTPVVPGVVVLDEVRALAVDAFGAFVVTAIPQVKFLAPLLPGEFADVVLDRLDRGIRFEVTRGADVIARGELTVVPKHGDSP
jgi:3-hydroxyacyl-[acyl-carrier-protein] dehydratase